MKFVAGHNLLFSGNGLLNVNGLSTLSIHLCPPVEQGKIEIERETETEKRTISPSIIDVRTWMEPSQSRRRQPLYRNRILKAAIGSFEICFLHYK